MNYSDIKYFKTINDTSVEIVSSLADSMISCGWQGCPIILFYDNLLTGSHRLEALREVERRWKSGKLDDYPNVLTETVAVDLTNEICEHLSVRGINILAPNLFVDSHDGLTCELSYDDIGWLLSGTSVDKYKSEIKEWSRK